MRKLNIALVSPPWYPVPPVGYGGIELVVALLATGLRNRGHQVHLFGAEGSASGTLVCAPKEWRDDLGRPQMSIREADYAGRVYRVLRGLSETIGDVDIVHEHAGMVSLLVAQAHALAPVIHTVHGPLDEAQHSAYMNVVDDAGLVAISHDQRASAPELSWVGTVHNAVDVDALQVGPADRNDPYVLVLARICPEKGQHLAIDAAARMGIRLVLAGKVETTPKSLDYYQRHVAPHVDGHAVVHIPNVSGDQKAALLSGATALLAPITWPEPFGLSVVEAMASGTPAIAFSRGAMPELIENGQTGFVVDDVEAMVDAVRLAGEIDHLSCAKRARQRFSPDAMVERYLEVYTRVLDRASNQPRRLEALGA